MPAVVRRRFFASIVDNNWTASAALALLHLTLSLLAFHQAPATGGDDAAYVSLARSIIERRDYTNIGDPALLPHTQYPPVFPAIVSVGLLANLAPSLGLRILAMVISALAVFASCLWLRRVASPGIAFCAGFFIAISPEIIRLGQIVLSDGAFWCFSILALLAWHRSEVAGKRPDGERGVMPLNLVIAASLLTLLAYFTRAAGAPLLLAVFIWLGLMRQPRALVVLAALSVPCIFAWWYRGQASGAESYLAPFIAIDPYNPSLGSVAPPDLVKRAVDNASVYASRQLSRLVLGTPTSGAAFGLVFAAVTLYGWARRARKVSLPEIWFALYLTLVLLWPVTWSGARFLLPVVPLIALYVAETVATAVRRGTYPKVYPVAAFVAASVAVFPALRNQVQYASGCRAQFAAGERFPCTDPVFSDFLKTAEMSRGKLPTDAVVLSRKPTIFHHYSGYRSRVYPMFAEPDSLFRVAERVGARYIVADRMSNLATKYLMPVLVARRDDFCVMPELSTTNATLLRIEVGGPRSVPGAAPGVFRVCDAGSRATYQLAVHR